MHLAHVLIVLLASSTRVCFGSAISDSRAMISQAQFGAGPVEDDLELLPQLSIPVPSACTPASRAQIKEVNAGILKMNMFLERCRLETKDSSWCDQLVRPNPASKAIFECTYSASQPHILIHPDEDTWSFPIAAVHLVQELEKKGLKVCQIYNWWRPEPYNKNVGGAAGRHPFATSIDVRFCSNKEADQGFEELCKSRLAGKIRAIGHYGTNALHFGIGDKVGNTWGRTCPQALLNLGNSEKILR